MVEAQDKFWSELFLHVWRGLYVPDATPTDLRSAVGVLMRSSCLNTECLAMRLGIMPNMVKNILVTGKARPEVLKNLSKVAQEFNMPLLAAWFDSQATGIYRNKGKKQSDMWGFK